MLRGFPLVLLSLFLVFWSSVPAIPAASRPLAPEQPHRPPAASFQGREVWAEWIRLPQRRRPYRRPAPPPSLRRRKPPRSGASAARRSGARRAPPRPDAALPAAGPQPAAPLADTPAVAAAAVAPPRRGRPRRIPTDHLGCVNLNCRGYGRPGPHPDHHIVGAGAYTTASGERRQLYRCQLCETRFSETAGTPFFGLKTPTDTVCRALKALSEGNGPRATARIFGVEPDTVAEWLRKAGQHCAAVSALLLQDYALAQAQLDELWTFVRKKERHLSAWEKLRTEYGDTWVWVVFDPVYKVVVALVVGEREEEQAVSLLQQLRARLRVGFWPLLLSDSLPHYAQAILRVFGRWVRPARRGNRGRFPKPRQEPPEELLYATVHKEKQQGRVVAVTQQVVYGNPQALVARLAQLGQTISTSLVERMNLTLRHLVSRLRRKGLTFSKKREWLVWHLQLALAYYHFVRPHRSLRRRLPAPLPTRGNGSPKKWTQRTPAMAAGLTDRVWTMEELLMYHVPMQP